MVGIEHKDVLARQASKMREDLREARLYAKLLVDNTASVSAQDILFAGAVPDMRSSIVGQLGKDLSVRSEYLGICTQQETHLEYTTDSMIRRQDENWLEAYIDACNAYIQRFESIAARFEPSYKRF